MKITRGIVVGLALICLTSSAVADPLPSIPAKLPNGGNLTTPGGANLDLPPGWYIVPGDLWKDLDLEMRRLQESETRLSAENKSLKASASERTGWYWIASAVVVGFGGGIAYQKWGK